jgi:protein-S-isoprenylcysteine O-methyltransferase Ste14
MGDKVKPWVYVAVQFATILFLLLTGRWFVRHPVGLAVQLAGIGLVLWAVFEMGWRRLRVHPVVDHATQLVTTGPYKVVRHPMYAASMMTVVPMVAQDFGWLRFAALVLLVVDLAAKAQFEERLLCAKFPDYPDYQKRVKQLVPWVY